MLVNLPDGYLQRSASSGELSRARTVNIVGAAERGGLPESLYKDALVALQSPMSAVFYQARCWPSVHLALRVCC